MKFLFSEEVAVATKSNLYLLISNTTIMEELLQLAVHFVHTFFLKKKRVIEVKQQK